MQRIFDQSMLKSSRDIGIMPTYLVLRFEGDFVAIALFEK